MKKDKEMLAPRMYGPVQKFMRSQVAPCDLFPTKERRV